MFGGYEGVPLLIGYLKKDPAGFLSGLGHDRLLLSAADCTWYAPLIIDRLCNYFFIIIVRRSAVIGNNVVEDIFLENGGIFCLLDMLQVIEEVTTIRINSIHRFPVAEMFPQNATTSVRNYGGPL